MTTTTRNSLDALLAIRDGYETARWNFPESVGTPVSEPGGIGESASLGYSFLTSAPTYYDDPIVGFATFNTYMKSATAVVLSYLSEVFQVTFTPRTSGGQILFGLDSQGAGVTSGYAWYPAFSYAYSGGLISSTRADPVGGDVWLNSDFDWKSGDFLPGNTGYETLLHEVGHALGLKHPFLETPEDVYVLASDLDNKAYTVMSYTEHPSSIFTFETPSGSEWREVLPSTLMPFDIAALQYLYGANTTTRTGDNVYTFDPFNPTIETIWDAGGVDTISVAGFYRACQIDLIAGHFSSLNPGLGSGQTLVSTTRNLAIAKGVTIERAIGGGGNDRLIGNAVANRLSGGAGGDILLGNEGADNLLGGAGADVLWGGVGNDVLYGGTEGDRLNGGSGNDLLRGNQGNDTLTGGVGGDAFRFDTVLNAASNVDSITDFASAEDGIQLDDAVFTRLVPGALPAGAFGRFGAADSSDRVLYSSASGRLYYDPDGSGATVATQFAVLSPGVELRALHFVVV